MTNVTSVFVDFCPLVPYDAHMENDDYSDFDDDYSYGEDDWMDSTFEWDSSMASAGWGTDEDYGFFGGDDGW